MHIVKAIHSEGLLLRSPLHGEGVTSPLKMLMTENAASHDGQISVGADKIMRKLLHKGEQLTEHRPVDDHGHMAAVHHDAVLVIVHIGGILHSPRLTRQRQRDDPQVLPRGMSRVATVPLVLHTQLAGGIAGGLPCAGGGNIAGILLRLG